MPWSEILDRRSILKLKIDLVLETRFSFINIKINHGSQ